MPCFSKAIPLILTLLATTQARTFDSRDATVRSIIANCSNVPLAQANDQCQATLGCILDSVNPLYSARWSAGASILAFIPTIVGLMSNSVDEVVLVAEENLVLAVLLSLCSVTAFVSRFGDARGEDGRFSTAHVLDEVRQRLDNGRKMDEKAASRRQVRYALFMGSNFLLLGALSAGVWYCVFAIARYAVIVFSCPSRVHVPLWVGLAQLLGVLNVLVRKSTMSTVTIPVHAARPGVKQGNTGSSSTATRLRTLPMWTTQRRRNASPRSIVLRTPLDTPVSHVIRLCTSILSFALYAFGTGILASMLMFPASDAIRVMVVIAASAGVGRIIGTWATSPHSPWKAVLVFDVPQRRAAEMEEKVRGLIDEFVGP